MTILSWIGRLARFVIIDDPGLKLLCLVLAVLMWFYIDGELMSQKEYELQMKPSDITLKDDLEVKGPPTFPKYRVTVRGPRRQFEFWPRESLRFKHKLVELPHAGKNAVRVTPTDIDAESFSVVSVEPVDPATNYIELVAMATVVKKVKVRSRNQPGGDFNVGAETVTPTEVHVRGNVEDLAAIDDVWTDVIDLAGVEQNFKVELPIVEHMAVNGRTISIKCSEKVTVAIPIEPKRVTLPRTLDIGWARVPPGLALRIDHESAQVEIVVEERDLKDEKFLSKISLYVEWPESWQRPKDATSVLGPTPVQIKVSAPPRIQVRGPNNTELPTVSVTGALAKGLQ